MRLLPMLLIASMHVSVFAFGQRVTLNKQNESLINIIKELKKQSGYNILYDAGALMASPPVNIHVKDAEITDVLDRCLQNLPLSYVVKGKNIIISRRNNDIPGLSQRLQQRIIAGRVTDASGEPLEGVNISLKGTDTHVVSTQDGRYQVELSAESTALVFTLVGYVREEITIGESNAIDVVLQQQISNLDEVIVVGYGTTSIRKTVSSVSTLKTDKIDELPFTSTAASLQGRVAGVIVQQNGGEPGGANPTLSIRGGGTPLYIIDGVIREPLDFNALTSADIESISVLKDASATAVYGAQAGNGIVLVKTKRGGGDRSRIDYTSGFDWNRPTVIPKRVNALDYVQAANRAAAYDGRGDYAIYPNEVVNSIQDKSDLENYPDNNWFDMATRSFAPQMRQNLSMSGRANSGTNYYVSLGYLDQQSLFKESHNNRFNRYNLRSNVTSSFEKIGLEVSLNIDGVFEKRTPNPYGQGEIWRNLLAYNKPIDVAYNPDGTYSAFSVHPLVWLDRESGYSRNRDNILNAQLQATWSLPWVDGLKATALGNSRYSNYNQKFFRSRAPQYSPDGELKEAPASEMQLLNSWWRNNMFEGGLAYDNTFGLHTIGLQGVYSFYGQYNEEFSASRNGFISNDFDQLFAGNASTQQNDGFAQEGARMGYVGRLNYSYANKYFLEGNFRYDGSDNFAKDKRWGLFPSGAVAWVISEENFMKPLDDRNIINFLKVRGSLGQVGLETGVNRFGYIPTYSYNAQSVVVGNRYLAGFSEGELVSEHLSWYTKDIFDIGVDLATLSNKLNFTFDYFYYRTKGYLISPQNQYSVPLGKPLPQVKSNSIHRRAGFEATARYVNRINDFRYDIGLNFTTYNELWEINESEAESTLKNPYKRSTHQKNFFGIAHLSEGIYQQGSDILDAPRRLSATELKPGDLYYRDVNGDGKIDDEDQVKIGKPFFPSFDYGVNFNFDYKGFSLYGLFQGTGDRYISLGGLMRGGNIVEMNYDYQLDFWHPDNRNAAYPRASSFQNVNNGNNTVASDFWIKNAAYFRMKSLQFGYDFKETVFKGSPALSRFKLSLLATNLFTFANIMRYYDPEVTDGGGQGYPVQQTFSLVLNIGL